MAKLTTTHTTTDLGLWWPYTDQGKTPWRVKTQRMGENVLHEEKTQIHSIATKQYIQNSTHILNELICWVMVVIELTVKQQ